jgi:hypothetical protein
VNRRSNAERMRRGFVWPAVAAVASILLLCLPAATAQHGGGGRAQAPHYSHPTAPRNEGRANQGQFQRPGQRSYQQPNQNQRQYQQPYGQQQQRPAYSGPGQSYARPGQGQSPGYARPAFPQNSARPGYPGAANVRPALPQTRPYSSAPPPGHLGSWLNQHRNMPVQGQEQLLRNDPSFRQLPQGDQQRLMHQLQQVNRMPEQERERRLARAEMIERMSPQERMQLNQSSRDLQGLPADRQALVKHAFQDLRSVPLDQRQTVLNSQRYQGMFSSQERGILGSLLRAEPYEPAK